MIFFSISNNYGQSSNKKFDNYCAFNDIKFEYIVLLPKNFDSDKTYKGIVSFASFKPKNDKVVVESLNHLWGNHKDYNSIIIVPKVPVGEANWVSHPIHHGFNDFLKMIKNNFKIENQKFHFLGFEGGCVPAQTYISMLEYPPASLTLLSSDYWEHYNDRRYNQLVSLNIPINLLYLVNDKKGINQGENVFKKLKVKKTNISFKKVIDYKTELDKLFRQK